MFTVEQLWECYAKGYVGLNLEYNIKLKDGGEIAQAEEWRVKKIEEAEAEAEAEAKSATSPATESEAKVVEAPVPTSPAIAEKQQLKLKQKIQSQLSFFLECIATAQKEQAAAQAATATPPQSPVSPPSIRRASRLPVQSRKRGWDSDSSDDGLDDGVVRQGKRIRYQQEGEVAAKQIESSDLGDVVARSAPRDIVEAFFGANDGASLFKSVAQNGGSSSSSRALLRHGD